MAANSGPARRRTLPSLRDDAIVAIIARCPLASHDALRVCCRRFSRLAERRAIKRHRASVGWGENAIVVAGGDFHMGDPIDIDRDETHALIGGRWREMQSQPRSRCDCCVVTWRGRMVCAGGCITAWDSQAGELVMSVGVPELVAFDAAEDRWLDMANPGERVLPSKGAALVCPITGALVIISGNGGWSKGATSGLRPGQSRRAMVALDSPEAAAWRLLAPPPIHVHAFFAEVIGEKLYLAGGWNIDWEEPSEPSDALWIYEFRTNTWSLGPPLPWPQYFGGGCALGSKLYVVSGKHARDERTSDVVIYDTVAESWTVGPPLPEPLEYFTAIVHQNRIVVIGDRSPLILDEAAGVWGHDPDVVPPLPWVPPDKPLYAAMTASVPVG